MIAVSPFARTRIVVGTGRLGRALAEALSRAGAAPAAVLAGRMVAAEPKRLVESLEVAGGSPVLLLAVRDEALPRVAAGIARAVADVPRGGAALHASGALGVEVLEPLARRGWATGSVHPLQTLTGGDRDAGRLRGSTFAVDGSGAGEEAAREVVRALGGTPMTVPADRRDLYHLAASIGANGLTGLVAAARDALAAAGTLDPADALRALAPLLRAALEEALDRGPEASLTGPAARGDDSTLERHRRALARWDATRLPLLEALLREQRRLVARGGGGTGC